MINGGIVGQREDEAGGRTVVRHTGGGDRERDRFALWTTGTIV